MLLLLLSVRPFERYGLLATWRTKHRSTKAKLIGLTLVQSSEVINIPDFCICKDRSRAM